MRPITRRVIGLPSVLLQNHLCHARVRTVGTWRHIARTFQTKHAAEEEPDQMVDVSAQTITDAPLAFRPDPHQVPVWTFCKLSTVLITVQSPVPLNHTLSPAA